MLKCSQSSRVVWSHGQQVCSSGTWMCLRASHLATLVRNGSCSLRSWMRCFWRWAGTFAGRSTPAAEIAQICNDIAFEYPTLSRRQGAKTSIAIHISILVHR